MNRIISSPAAFRVMVWRARLVPVLSTLVASTLALAPAIGSAPLLPPLGLVTLLCWRLLRPELWPAWVGLPLGLADDLIGGQPLGTGMCLWTLSLLLLDEADPRLMVRDWGHEWAIAAAVLALAMVAGLVLEWLAGRPAMPHLLVIPYLLAVLCVPPVARCCALLDRWRLPR